MSPRDAWDYHMVKFQITKKTAKRIFYLRDPINIVDRGYPNIRGQSDGTARIDRQKIEAEGSVYTGHHWCPDSKVYLAPPPLPKWERDVERVAADLPALKAAMIAAHPDKGGSKELFIVARAKYVAARRAARA
jgi:hypothetical protein